MITAPLHLARATLASCWILLSGVACWLDRQTEASSLLCCIGLTDVVRDDNMCIWVLLLDGIAGSMLKDAACFGRI